MKLIIAWIKELYLLANTDFYFCQLGEVPQFGGEKNWRRNEQQQLVWPASLTTSQRTAQLRMQDIQFVVWK